MSKNCRSVVFDFASNHGDPNFIGIRKVEFFLAGELIEISYAHAIANTYSYGYSEGPWWPFISATNKAGTWDNNSWLSLTGQTGNKRVIFVFPSNQDVDEIVINNFHTYGVEVDRGVNGTVITLSTDELTIPTWGDPIPNSEVIFDGAIPAHADAYNAADDYIVPLNFIDCYLPLASASSGSLDVSVLLESPAFSAAGSLSGSVFGPVYVVSPPALGSAGDLAGVISLKLSPPGLESVSGFIGGVFDSIDLAALSGISSLSADLKNGLEVPDFLAAGALSMSGVFLGYPVPLGNPFESVGLLSADVSISLAVPALISVAEITATPTRLITMAPFSSSGGLAAADPVSFRYLDYVTLFYFTLTGSADGLADVVIPISSFQAVHRTDRPSYLSVTIPDDSYSQQITDRANGELVVRMARQYRGVVYHSEEIIRVDFEELRPDGGGQRKSITLTGHGTTSFSSKIVEINSIDISYKTGSPGSRRFRLAKPDIFIRPGDTANYSDNSITIDRITYTVGPGQAVMEVSE